MTTFKWIAPEAIVTALSTGLNSLASTAFSALSAEIDNETDLYFFIDLELSLASFTPGAGSPYCAVYFVYDVSGTYEKTPDGTSGDKPPDAIFPLEASVAQASIVVIPNIPIPPLPFEITLKNVSGAALASANNTLKYRRHNRQGV